MKNVLFSLGLAALIASCGSTKKEETTKTPAKVEVSASANAISDYMSVKDALVQTDASAAKDAAVKLGESATAENWNAVVIKAVKTIASSDDIETQRTAFKTVTDGLIEALKANDSNDGVFVQYCPMAFDNTGASWLSMSDQIRNPYFGDKMLKCGKVTEEL
ncbi:DUF3347 domain-containing protein [Ekhidna sp.]|uniref:DUF3347 domain-containing protein n=1 Tax=Ekhidna sp. TaxID=2608089 RepID=UPI00329743BC